MAGKSEVWQTGFKAGQQGCVRESGGLPAKPQERQDYNAGYDAGRKKSGGK